MNARIDPNDLLGALALLDDQTEDDRDEQLQAELVMLYPTKEAQES